jgi:hypothetical protein
LPAGCPPYTPTVSQLRVRRRTSKTALRRHRGQINHSRCRAYPSPNDPPPIDRCVITT